jgi:predicted DNA-binding transcriptional regulator YafY
MLNQHKILRVFKLISLLKKPPAKSTRNIAILLDITERSVYRYIDLIAEIGFDVKKNKNNKYAISMDDAGADAYFTLEEATLIKELLLSTAKNSALKAGILKKIFVKSEIDLEANHIINANNSKLVAQLNEAIAQNKQVELQKYFSANSNNISNRIIEPIKFTNNYQMLCAYEIASKKNKFFSIERIGAVKILDKNFEHVEAHRFEQPDAFGFVNMDDQKTKIDLLLSIRAYVILKQEYPMVVPYIKVDNKNKTYRLTLEVNNIKPVTRFVLGFLDEITVLGSDDFIAHLRTFVGQLYENNKKALKHKSKD